ncbi:hypothetical protein [Streptomyces longisporoflavus]|uniref:Uncharacterized protein n=1 Tax=Streptomyces longisporoflavus TaxID=28044 RepID=A0ABW7QJF3_9ACTN
MRISDCDRAHITVSEARAENVRVTTAPGQLVAQARRLAEKAQELVDQAVIAERQRDTSWEQIGAALGGLSKSAAHKRYGTLVTEWAEYLDTTTTDDEDSQGQNILASPFSIAYALVERTWKEADSVIHAQELLEELNNATVAVSGAAEMTTDDFLSAFEKIDKSQFYAAVRKAAARAAALNEVDQMIPPQSGPPAPAKYVGGTPKARALMAQRQKGRRLAASFGEANDCPRCAEPATWRALSPQEADSVEDRLSTVERILAELLAKSDTD